MTQRGRKKDDPFRCNGCGKIEGEVEFNFRVENGIIYRKHLCKQCDSKRSLRYPNKPESRKRSNENQKRKLTMDRKDSENAPKFIVMDSRRSDKIRGFSNDLTQEFVRTLLSSGCCYCGETNGRLTLDRVDNSLGHIQSNVVPACIRCNYVRGNMPYAAWVVVAEGMKRAKELGLFGVWVGRVPKKIGKNAV